MRNRILVLSALTFLAVIPDLRAQVPDETAKKVRAVLENACYRCHGKNGAVEGGFSYMLDRQQLVSRKQVVPGDSGKSRLFRRLERGEMPPEGEKPRPSPEEIAVLKKWIDAGAPDFNPPVAARKFITTEEMLAAMHEDSKGRDEGDRKFTRYLTLTHLYNAGRSEDELQSFRQGVSKLINSLSWGRKVVAPVPVDPAKTILRIDLRDYKWTPKAWDLVASSDPFGLLHTANATARNLYANCACQLPHVRADWFVASASRPPLYHAILQLPETEKELESLVRVDAAEGIRAGQVVRAGFNGSGVSRNNRLIERYESSYGYYWKSYDFAKNLDRQNLFAHPLGPGAAKDHFKQDGGELIFSLPNGLQGYMIVNVEGKRLDKAPTEIVSDPNRPDRAVETGLSCMTCHVRGILPKADQIRDHVEKNRTAFGKKELETILQLYPAKDQVQQLMRADADKFKKAVEETGVQLGITEPIAALTTVFESDIDLPLAAAEAGLKAADFQEQLKQSPALARALGNLQVSGGIVHRETFAKNFELLARTWKLGTPMPKAAAAAKPPAKTGPLIKATDKTPGGWLLKVAQVRTNVFSDRQNYVLAQLPKEIQGGTLLLRDSEQSKSWIEPSKLTATREGTVFAIIRWKYLGKEEADEVFLDKFMKEGWEELKGDVKTTFPAGEDWRWKAFSKKLDEGDVILQLQSLNWGRVPVVYVFK
jgi:cytochrome c